MRDCTRTFYHVLTTLHERLHSNILPCAHHTASCQASAAKWNKSCAELGAADACSMYHTENPKRRKLTTACLGAELSDMPRDLPCPAWPPALM